MASPYGAVHGTDGLDASRQGRFGCDDHGAWYNQQQKRISFCVEIKLEQSGSGSKQSEFAAAVVTGVSNQSAQCTSRFPTRDFVSERKPGLFTASAFTRLLYRFTWARGPRRIRKGAAVYRQHVPRRHHGRTRVLTCPSVHGVFHLCANHFYRLGWRVSATRSTDSGNVFCAHDQSAVGLVGGRYSADRSVGDSEGVAEGVAGGDGVAVTSCRVDRIVWVYIEATGYSVYYLHVLVETAFQSTKKPFDVLNLSKLMSRARVFDVKKKCPCSADLARLGQPIDHLLDVAGGRSADLVYITVLVLRISVEFM